MTVKQLIRRLNKNANFFATRGDLKKAFACLGVAAMLKRDYVNVSGKLEINL